MSAKAAKAKGNRFENYLIEVLRERLDKKAQRTYGSGSGLDKNDIRLPSYDIEIEAKNQATWKMPDYVEQLQSQKTNGNMSVLAIRNPAKPEFQETFVLIYLEDFIELAKHKNEVVEVESNYDPQLKWKIKRLKDAANEVFKELT